MIEQKSFILLTSGLRVAVHFTEDGQKSEARSQKMVSSNFSIAPLGGGTKLN
jgi:hypothetical protein